MAITYHRASLLGLWGIVCGAITKAAQAHDGRFYDELLWTKSNWQEYVLAFPHDDVLAKLGPSSRAYLGAIIDFEALKEMSASTAIDFNVRAEALSSTSELFSPSNKATIPKLLGCNIQTALAEVLWPAVSNWTMVHLERLEDRDLRKLVDEACRIDVPVVVLKEEVLLQVTIEREQERYGKNEDRQIAVRELLPYVVSMPRHSQHALQSESSAVAKGCMNAADATWREMLIDAQHTYLDVLRGVIVNKNAGKDADNDVKKSGKKKGGIEIDRSCCDYHPQCQYWAKKGECKANPKYMVGSENTGQCRLACGSCQPPDMPAIPSYLTASNAQMIEDAYTETLVYLLETSERCNDGQDGRIDEQADELEVLLRKHSSSHARGIADQMRAAVRLELPNEGAGSVADSQKDTSLVEADEVAGTVNAKHVDPIIWISDFANAAVPMKEHEKELAEKMKASMEDNDDEVKAELYDIMHDRCVHVDVSTYWTYQFCYGIGLLQYHKDESEKSVTTIRLGYFAETPESWTLVGDGTNRAVVHDYSANAAECFETNEPRKATVRFLCDDTLSNNAGIRVEVSEPELCKYEVAVFLADLCPILQ